MPNTINLRLLDNKNIIAELNGIPLAQENSYKIIAGEENATQFVIASKPTQYEMARYTVEMVNSQGYGVDETDIQPNLEGKLQFNLPEGMAVAGYGWIRITAYQADEVVRFVPLKVKVWNTIPTWKDHIGSSLGAKIENGHLFIQDKNGKWVDLGIVKGEKGGIPVYDNTKTYFVGDVVTYDGGIYECYSSINGMPPPDPRFWRDMLKLAVNGLFTLTLKENGAYTLTIDTGV